MNPASQNFYNTPLPQPSQSISYAQKLQIQSYPRKDQAIIINQIPNIPVKDHVLSLGKIINPSKILFASSISQQRLCVYLSNREEASKLVRNYSKLLVKNIETPIRSYLTPTHRLLLWVMPDVSNEIILHNLKQLKVIPTSNIYSLSMGMSDTGYSHIKSFRRFVFVHDNHPTLPDKVEINCNNETYTMFITIDNTKCSRCNKFGHESENCKQTNHTTTNPNNLTPILPENKNNNTESQQNQKDDLSLIPLAQRQTTTVNSQQFINETQNDPILNLTPIPFSQYQNQSIENTEIINTNNYTDDKIIPETSNNLPNQHDINENRNKRKKVTSSSSQIDFESMSASDNDKIINSEHNIVNNDVSMDTTNIRPSRIRRKKKVALPIEDQLDPLKPIMKAHPHKFIMSFHELLEFIKSTKGLEKQKIKDIVKQTKIEPHTLSEMLTNLKPDLEKSAIKSKFTKIINIIQNNNDKSETPSQPDEFNEEWLDPITDNDSK